MTDDEVGVPVADLGSSDVGPLQSRLFEAGYEFTGEVTPEAFNAITDPDDRKFAALAAAADVELVSQDDHLLSVAKCWPGRLRISSPPAFARRWKLRD